MRELFPAADIYSMYGLTEAFRSTYLDPALLDTHLESIGTAIPFAEVMAVRPDGSEAEAGEEGELVHSGPLVAKGYWKDPARTAERFKPAPAASRYGGMAVWSGDRVRRDAAGLLYFVGRADGMIKTAGNRVSPTEVEEAAITSGLVAEAVALGTPDARLGQAIALVARPTSGPQEEQLRAHLKRMLPNFMQPAAILWREELPRSPNGKIDRNALAAELTA
jgi:acyl-coenzyme A synthetase/AMP-(fatty) acid ligase